MWQCLHRRNFSTINEKRIPKRINNDIDSPKPVSSIASGIRWIKASPKSAPTEKLTKYMSIFFNCCSFNHKVAIPINEIRLIITTEPIANNQLINFFT